MNFCPVCDYLLFIETYYEDKIEKKPVTGEAIKVRNICKNCGHTDNIENEENKLIMISNTTNDIDNVDVSSFMNKYTIHDKTTPHVDNIPCQNLECVTHNQNSDSTVKNDVMFVRYDHINLKYLYQCTHCRHTWKN
jgi:DNA-directed RNA polymerase subunit M/transcription elongation factor TFIIS